MPVNIFSFVLVLTIQWATTVTLERNCPNECVCEASNSKQVVDCTNINVSELDHLPEFTTDLILKNGRWDTIDFGKLPSHLAKLLTVSIYNYTTYSLKRYNDSEKQHTFKEVKSVSIQHTDINSIRDGVFDFFPKASHFNLSFNHIDQIYENPFSGLQHIEFVNLSNNNIETIKSDTFTALQLNVLDLSNNAKLNKEIICQLSA